jgi:hypothetical protein
VGHEVPARVDAAWTTSAFNQAEHFTGAGAKSRPCAVPSAPRLSLNWTANSSSANRLPGSEEPRSRRRTPKPV